MATDLDPIHDALDTTPDVGVFILDDHDGFRSIVRQVVDVTEGFAIVGSAESWVSGRELFAWVAAQTRLVLVDVMLGEESGLDAAIDINRRHEEVKVLLISTLSAADLPEQARECGASGFLPKSKLSPNAIAGAWRGDYDW